MSKAYLEQVRPTCDCSRRRVRITPSATVLASSSLPASPSGSPRQEQFPFETTRKRCDTTTAANYPYMDNVPRNLYTKVNKLMNEN